MAEELHFTRAAARIHLSQSTLSAEIRRLEGVLGTPLFVRTSRKVALTSAGEALLAELRPLLTSLEDVLASAASHTPRPVRLAYTPSIADQALSVLLRQLSLMAPSVKIEDREFDTGEVPAVLRNREFDLGLYRFPEADGSLRSAVIRHEPIVAVVSARHRLARREVIELRELDGDPLLLWDRRRAPEYYDRIVEICRSTGRDPLIVLGPPRPLARPDIFVETRGFTLLPVSTAERRSPGIVFLRIDAPPTLPLSVVWHASERRPDVLAVVESFRATATALGWDSLPTTLPRPR